MAQALPFIPVPPAPAPISSAGAVEPPFPSECPFNHGLATFCRRLPPVRNPSCELIMYNPRTAIHAPLQAAATPRGNPVSHATPRPRRLAMSAQPLETIAD